LGAYDVPVTVVIRRAESADFEAICDLVVLLKLISDRSRITNTFDGSSYWVACTESGAIVGCVGLEHGTGASLLRSTAVHPSLQGQGIGSRLALLAIEGARLRGDRSVHLFSSHAGTYWQRFGFVSESVWALADALPTVQQVISGKERGWIVDEQAWVLHLRSPLIRVVDAEDWESWRSLRLAALADAPSAFGSTLAEWQGRGDNEERWRDRLSIPGAVDLVAHDSDTDTATGMLSAVPDIDDSQRVWLISMWVSPNARGKGVAVALIGHVTQWAKASGRTSVNLMVRHQNHHAIALYERCGFRQTGGRETELDSAGVAWTEVEMTRAL
jgi:ribosomal protein S18 acetylase RimI-like enzyme